jgi:uncharacterized protein YbjQ (UPF0145 family)
MGLKTPDTLPPKLLERVHGCIQLETDEQLALVFDRTTLGSLKAGLAITNLRVVEYDKDKATPIRLDDVASVRTSTSPGTCIRELVLEGRSGAKLATSVYLSDAGLEELLAPIRAHVGPTTEWPGKREAAAWEKRVQRGSKGFLLSTTPTIEGRPIRDYLGVVSGEAVMGANAVVDILGKLSDIAGGRSVAYESEFMDARESAFHMLEEAAIQLGANGVVGIDLDYEVVGASGSMMLVSVNGTAVVLADQPEARV